MNVDNLMPTATNTITLCLKQLGIATLYALVGYVIHRSFASHGVVGVFWPGSGLALAALLIGGRNYLWGIFLGALLVHALTNNSLIWIVSATLANMLEVLLGAWLLMRNDRFSPSLNTLSDYLRLIVLGGGVASILPAIIGVSALLFMGVVPRDDAIHSILHWWMGDTLGVVLVTPLILAWWPTQLRQLTDRQLLEGLLLVCITFIVGQIVFLDWFKEGLTSSPEGCLTYLCIVWVAIRMGTRGATLVLFIIAIQGLVGTIQEVGFFANDLARADLHNYWFYMLSLSVVGVALSSYVDEIRQEKLNLRSCDEDYHSILATTLDGFWIVNPQGKLLEVNNRYTHQSGYSHEELLNMHITDLEAIESEDAAAHIQRIIETGGDQFASVHRRKDGSIWHVDVSITYLKSNGGKFFAFLRDITERKAAEDALRGSEEMLRAITENAQAVIFIKDIAGQYLFVNRKFEQLFHVTVATIQGKTDYDIFPKDVAGDCTKNDQIVAQSGQPINAEVIVPHDDGPHTYITVKFPLRKVSGEIYAVCGIATDITERKQMEDALRKNEAQFRAIFEVVSVGIVQVDPVNGKIIRYNDKYRAITGYTDDELCTMPVLKLTHPDDRQRDWEIFSSAARNETPNYRNEKRYIRKDGSVVWVRVNASFVRDNKGLPIHTIAVCEDITERKQAEAELRIAAIAFESQEGMMVTDANGVILKVNRAFTETTGYTAEEAVGQTPRILKSGRHNADFYREMWETLRRTGTWQGEIWDRRKNGELFPKWLIITAVKDDGKITHYVGTHADITDRKAAEEEIKHLAFYDPLTGLPNRRLLRDRLKLALASSHRNGQKGALLFIDLDNFKILNDTLGHDMGDVLLQQVAERLTACVREGDTVARLGGDEFVMMLEDLSEQALEAAAQAEAIGNKILTTLNLPYQLVSHEYHSTPSIGATLFNGHEQSGDNLLKQADIAMYQAKAAGRNALRFFDPHMQDSITTRVALEADLRQALAENQFKLHYQPQVHHNRQIISAEALIRWQHPQRGLVSPADFIPLAEETDLILSIGQWVLKTACAQIKIWEGNTHTQYLQLAINVSARQFHQADFVEEVCQVLRHSAIKPDRLKLELTETVVLNDIDDTILKMNALREIGVRFSMDDFGTGYSSLSSLKKLPFDQLKIDQSFVRDLSSNPDDAIIVQTIIAMGNKLGMEVVAEGVETEAQRAFLEQHGCSVCQGYLFGKPVPLPEFEQLLKHS